MTGLDVEMVGCRLAIIGSLRVLERGGDLHRVWLTFLVALGLALAAMLVVAYVWLTAPDEETWRVRKLVGVVADAVVLNACIQVVRGPWPMRAAWVAQPYVYFIVAALAFIVRALLDIAGVASAVDTVFATMAWIAVVAAPWEQAKLTRGLQQPL